MVATLDHKLFHYQKTWIHKEWVLPILNLYGVLKNLLTAER